jgi:uncharacterized protein YegP (UPF0339 family)
MKFDIYQDEAGEWRWRMKAGNGRIMADSGEGYTARSGAERALRAIWASIHVYPADFDRAAALFDIGAAGVATCRQDEVEAIATHLFSQEHPNGDWNVAPRAGAYRARAGRLYDAGLGVR